MKFVFLPLAFFVLPLSSLAAECWVVAGAGTSAVDGEYYNIGDGSSYPGGETGFDAFGIDGLTDSFMIVRKVSGYSVLYEYATANSYGYYQTGTPSDDFANIDTADFGSAPVPSVTYFADCSAVPPPSPPPITIAFDVGTTTCTTLDASTTQCVSIGGTRTVDNPTQDLFNGYMMMFITAGGIIWFFRRK